MTQESRSTSDVLHPNPRRQVIRRWRKRILRCLVVYVLIPYCVVTVIFALMQRHFMYPAARVDAISSSDAQLPDGQVHTVSVKTVDGIPLGGWLVLADGRRAEDAASVEAELAAGRPVVLYFPGNAGNRVERALDCRDFTSANCDLFLFDYRGYGENSGTPSETSLLDDARSIWDYLTSDCRISPDRIIVFGESLGGAIATHLVADVSRDGIPPAGLILNSTFSSMPDVVHWNYPYFPFHYLLLDRYQSDEKIGDVTCPVVITHGADDEIVPIHLARKLFVAAPPQSASGVRKEFIQLNHSGHNDIAISVLRDSLAEMLDAATRPVAPEG